MFDQRSVVLAVLLLAAPLAALGGSEPTTNRAGESSALDLNVPLISELLLTTPFQVLINGDELLDAEGMPVIVVRGSQPIEPWSVAAEARCGLWGIAWSIVHPAYAWREVAFLPAESNGPACLRSAAAIEHIPEALAPVHWYQ